MFYVREIKGRLVVADKAWTRLYESGGLCDKDPIAAFPRKEDAEAFAAQKDPVQQKPAAPTAISIAPPGPMRLGADTPAPSVILADPPAADTPRISKAPGMSKAEYRQSQMKDFTPKGSPVIINVSYGPSSRVSASKPYKPAYRTKDEAMRAALQELCDRYKFHAAFRDGLVNITTVAGEWFFRYNDRPIQLFHKNPEVWYFGDGTVKPGAYHNQMMRFYSPADVLQYIYAHERKRISMLAEGGNN